MPTECWGPNDIRKLRQRLHLSRARLAKKLRVGPDSVRHWENEHRIPSPPVEVLLSLLEANFDYDAYLVRQKLTETEKADSV